MVKRTAHNMLIAKSTKAYSFIFREVYVLIFILLFQAYIGRLARAQALMHQSQIPISFCGVAVLCWYWLNRTRPHMYITLPRPSKINLLALGRMYGLDDEPDFSATGCSCSGKYTWSWTDAKLQFQFQNAAERKGEI